MLHGTAVKVYEFTIEENVMVPDRGPVHWWTFP